MTDAEIRQRFAMSVARSAGVRAGSVVQAFATVAREAFLPAPPWRLRTHEASFDSSDAGLLYGDVQVAIDPARDLWQAEPQLWAFVIDRLAVPRAGRVLLVGAGSGYLAAVLAELVGRNGQVVALEAVPELAERARAALAPWAAVRVEAAEASSVAALPFDRILLTCGITGLPDAWPNLLGDGARLAAPFTGADTGGVLLLLERGQAGTSAMPLSGVRIQPAVGGLRDPRQERVLDGVRRADPEALWQVRSLRPAKATRPGERLYGFGAHVLSSRPIGQ